MLTSTKKDGNLLTCTDTMICSQAASKAQVIAHLHHPHSAQSVASQQVGCVQAIGMVELRLVVSSVTSMNLIHLVTTIQDE